MTALPRRLADPLLPILVISLAALAIGCGSTATSSARASVGEPTPSVALTPVPGRPSARPSSAPSLPSTTTTDFGAIFDALPPSFPKLPGQEPSETGAGPTSGVFAVNGEPAALSASLAAALVRQGWTADTGSPLEDGTIVLEAAGRQAGCKAEVRFTPMSGTVLMSVLYGASCPFG